MEYYSAFPSVAYLLEVKAETYSEKCVLRAEAGRSQRSVLKGVYLKLQLVLVYIQKRRNKVIFLDLKFKSPGVITLC